MFVNCFIKYIIIKDCDVFECPNGPIRFYEDMYCNPIFKNEDDCCPEEYDCSHVYSFNLRHLRNNCIINNNTYKIGEKMNYIDLPRDKKNCICAKENNYIPEFKCENKCTGIIGRYNRRTCYIRISRDVCNNQVVCPKRRLSCLIDGVRRIEGETFFLNKYPLKECICQTPNSRGIKIFCFKHKNFCHTESLFIKMLIKKEAPFYFSDDNPQTYCPAYSKIYTEGDEMIQPTKIISKHARNCTYGILSMPIGAKLKNYNSRSNEFSCAECECIIPPSLTCKALTRFECEKSFQNFKNNSINLIPQKRLDKCVVINKDI